MEEKVIKIISDLMEIDESEIKLESNLSSDLNMESLDLVDLIVEFENEFDVEIKDQDIKNIQTVQDIVDYINENK